MKHRGDVLCMALGTQQCWADRVITNAAAVMEVAAVPVVTPEKSVGSLRVEPCLFVYTLHSPQRPEERV